MGLIFLLWISVCAAADLLYRRCFNWLILLGLGLAVISATLNLGILPFNIYLADRLIGFSAAFFIFLIFYLFKFMGAGDVKFAAVLGAWVGWEFFILIWALSCGFALLHGLVVRSDLKYFFFSCDEMAGWNGKKYEKIYSLRDLFVSSDSDCFNAK